MRRNDKPAARSSANLPDRPSSRRHPADAVSLVTGTVFCGLALSWLLVAMGTFRVQDLGIALPLLLIGAGLLGVVASKRRG